MRARLLLIGIGTLMVMIFVGTQFQVSSQGDSSATYPKGFRGGTCTIESDVLLVGYSAYFIPANYAVPKDAISAVSVPVLCGKVPNPGTLGVTIDLLYPESARQWPLALSLVRMGRMRRKKQFYPSRPESTKPAFSLKRCSSTQLANIYSTFPERMKSRWRSAWRYRFPSAPDGTRKSLHSGPCCF